MIFTIRPLKVNLHQSQTPLESFCRWQRYSPGAVQKEGLFVRYIGRKAEDGNYMGAIERIEKALSAAGQKGTICYVSSFDQVKGYNEMEKYITLYENWKNKVINYAAMQDKLFEMKFPMQFEDEHLEWTQKVNLEYILKAYKENEPGINDSMAKNFGIKLLTWNAEYLPKLFGGLKEKGVWPKIIYIGNIKKQEAWYLYYLFLLGCDVLYLNPKEDFSFGVKKYSLVEKENNLEDFSEAIKNQIQQKYIAAAVSTNRVPIRETDSQQANQTQSNTRLQRENGASSQQSHRPAAAVTAARQENDCLREMSYEELAKLSTSVVMVKVYDNNNMVYGSGSGVVISEEGYILTNFHVVRGASTFGIQFENEEEEYRTYKVVKYHQDYDLAIIKVEKNCKPIPLYRDNKLVRGTRVVAIGSPLGLFNTVSDGIISAFREMRGGRMIQFTAPTSHGSSGGALLDMYGRLIGITTAGFEEGEGLNLAVDSESIYYFAYNYLDIK